MKKIVTIIIALAMVMLIAAPSFASEAEQEPVSGGTLSVLVANMPAAFGNLKESSWSIDVTRYILPCVEPLVGMDENGLAANKLATGWEVAEDGSSVTFTLRENVKFHDGTDFNAEAVKWNIEKIIDLKNELKVITSIDVIDDYTVRLNLSSYSNTLLYHLSYYDGMMISPASYEGQSEDYIATHMVGTGPFVFDTFEADTKITFVKNENYWQEGKPYLEGWEWILSTDAATSKNAMLTGEADAWDNVAPTNAESLTAEGYGLNYCPGLIRVAHPDSSNPDSPLAKKEVRYAIEYAIDKQAIVDAFGGGTWQVPNGLSAASQIGGDAVEARGYDPDKAVELLTEAGYPDGFDMVIIAPRGVSADILTAMQGYLMMVGINAEIMHLDNASVNAYRTGGWENGILVQGMTLSTSSNALAFQADGPSPSKSFSTLVTDEYKTALDKAVGATTVENEKAYTDELLQLADAEENIIPIVIEARIAVFNANVHNFDDYAFSQWVINPADTWIEQ